MGEDLLLMLDEPVALRVERAFHEAAVEGGLLEVRVHVELDR